MGAGDGMYIDRPVLARAIDLEQGDILAHVPVPNLLTAEAFQFVPPKQNKWTHPFDKSHLRNLPSDSVRVVVGVRLLDHAVVITPTCDIYQGHPILLATTKPYKFDDDAAPDAVKWEQISADATGTANPKAVYLPASPRHGLPRSRANLGDLVPVTARFLDCCREHAGMTRVCGMTDDGVRRLRWCISTTFSRAAREDFDWPSHEDLALKREYLKARLVGGSRTHARDRAELEAIEKILGGGQPAPAEAAADVDAGAAPARATAPERAEERRGEPRREGGEDGSE